MHLRSLEYNTDRNYICSVPVPWYIHYTYYVVHIVYIINIIYTVYTVYVVHAICTVPTCCKISLHILVQHV